MESYYFSIEKATRDSGDYFVYECKNGKRELIFKRFGKNPYGGLKEARQAIGLYLQKCGYGLNEVFEHYCVIYDRENNSPLEWTLERYLIGVPKSGK